MRRIFALFVILVCIWLVPYGEGNTSEAASLLEPDASLTKVTNKQVQALVLLFRLYGYRCDSVSAASPYLWGYGFNLYCNRFRYSYDIEDVGGRWKVKVD